MTDKSFGDFYNKNTIKNPLLSSAVTGLSLDELTHKAVLLPVSSIQEQNARSEQQGTQNATLSHTHHDQLNPAGDAFPNIHISTQTIPSTNNNLTNIQKSVKTDNTQKLSTVSQSKASVKSEDDFDVNEYIARLQGSRYVSAPLHSHLKEDNNANLTTTEENLEEINLNETQNIEVHQQSLTADLAQNFSQLPTVLPHVASAVFSSFSNMLNLRSRDQTPDDRVQEVKPTYQDQGSHMDKPGVYQGSGLQQGNTTVPLMVEDRPPKDLAPPPREPPVMTGPSNFRLPPKKKYAQIPGLSTGEAQTLPYSSQAQTIPSFFTPGQATTGASEIENQKSEIEASAMPTFFTPSAVTVGASETANSKDVNKQAVQTSSAPVFFTPPSVSVGASETANVNVQSSTNINMFSATNEPYRSEIQANVRHFFTPASVAIGQSEAAISHAQNITRDSHKPDEQRTAVPNFFTPALVTAGASETTNMNATNIDMVSSNELQVQSTSIPASSYPGSASEIANTNNITNMFAPNEQHKTGGQASTMPVFFTPSSQTTGENETALKSNVSNVKIFTPIEPKVETVSPAPFADTQAPIIPPPPMFSNLRRDSQSTPVVGKTILPPSVARRISANQPLIRSQNVPMPCPENIFVPEPTNVQANLRQETRSDISRSIHDQTLPNSTGPPNLPSAPTSGPTLFNPSSIASTDHIKPIPVQVYQIQPQIASTPQSTSQQLAQPSSQPPKTPYPGIQSSTSGPQIFNPYSQTSESQSTGVPMFFTPSEIPSRTAELSVPPIPSSEQSIFPPSTPALSQSSSLFTPEIQPYLVQSSTVPSSIYSPQNEPPKTPIEPPKTTGPVSFRMTKKRPQYYSGPIEGVGTISNQIKPTIPTAVPDTGLQTSLFTPEPSQPQGFSINRSHDKIQETYNTSFDESQFQPSPFDLNQPQQSQEYNTAFDLSRPATEAYEQPKPEPKGFGIIGSLKTKLSSIDINKIQSTVTTFFDPAYNDTKKVETRPQDNVPLEPGHKVHVNSFDYSSHYGNNPYDYQQRNNQSQQESNGCEVIMFNDDNGDVFHGCPATNLPPGLIPPGFPTKTSTGDNLLYIQPKHKREVENEFQTQNTNINTEITTSVGDNKNENILLPQPDVITTLDQHFREDSGYTNDIFPQITHSDYFAQLLTSSLLNTSQQDASDTSFHGDNSSQYGHVGSSVPQKSSGLFNYPSCSELEARDVNPDLIEDTLRQFPNTAQSENLIFNQGNAAVFFDSPEDNINIDDVPTLATLAQTLDDDEPTQDTPSNNFSQRIDDFNIQAKTLADNLTNLTVSEAVREPAEIRPMNNVNRRQSAEALAAASTVPLFGLSAIIADRNREVEEVRPFNNARRHSILGSNSSASFFENLPTNDSVLEKTDLKGLSITDVRNVLLIEPPQEDICQVLKRNASSNLESTSPEDNYLLDTPSSSFFDHTLRDVEHEDSDLNICETCREVNTPEPKNIDVTGRLIDNITSRIQLSNTVDYPYIDNIAPNVSIRETAIDDQLEEIRHITEDTIETLQAQSAIELLDDMPNPEYEAYSTAIQSCKYAFEDPEPVVKSSLNFKLDPDTEASLDYSAYYNSATLFYHNRMPENASDEIKANYQASSQEDSDASDDKSEPGLDVHLIEQDANQDYPVDEEYIIEPSETDDDKIETRGRLRTPETSDTFTNRVERFQKAIDAGECFMYNSPTSLASYFDTGNYAVEAHFRNSQPSPDLSSLRFPPGFEDEYDRRMSGYNGSPLAPQIPDCGSQTSSINTATYSNPQQMVRSRYDRRMSGYSGSPLATQIPDCGSQTSSINTATFSNPQQRHRTFSNDLQQFPILLKAETDKPASATSESTEEVFRGPETAQLFQPTAPELSVIEAKTPDLSTNDSDSQKTETLEISEIEHSRKHQVDDTSQEAEKSSEVPTNILEQKTLDVVVTEELRPTKNVTGSYSTLSQLTTDSLTQEPNNTSLFVLQTSDANLLQEANPTPILFNPQAADERRTEIAKESDHKPQLTTNIDIKEPTADFFKHQEQNTTKRGQEEPEIAKVLQEEEHRPAIEPLTSTNIFDAKPAASIAEPKSTINLFETNRTNIFNNAGTRHNEKQIETTNIFEAKPPQNINIPSQALPDPLNFFSSKDDIPKPESSDFNRLASYFSTPPSKPDHSKSFFELSQSQNHYRHSSANSAQYDVRIEQNLDQNSRQNLTNIIKDLTSTQNLPNQENIINTVNYFTVEYELRNDVKELETDEKNTIANDGDNSNIVLDKNNIKEKGEKQTNNAAENLDEKTEIDNQNLIEQTKHDAKIEVLKDCQLCKTISSEHFKVRTCTNDTEPPKENSPSELDRTVTKKTNFPVTGNMLKNEEAEDGVTVVVETQSSEYTPVRHHWFYRVDVEEKSVWRGFSVLDSNALEEAFNRPDLNENTVVPTDGGRFDVNVVGRLRLAVYWKEKPTNVRRCSWFYKGTTDSRYVPYTEGVAEKLEEEYRHGITTGEWHRRLVLPNNEVVIMHGPSVMVHFWQDPTDAFSTPAITLLGKRVYRNPPKIRVAKDQSHKIDHLVFFVHGAGEYKRKEDATSRPRVVRRGHEESEIEEANPTGMDHLLLLCHGVGSACDMRFRSVEEVVEDFRATSLQLVQSHYKNSYENGIVNRVEVLPISWHAQLHGGEAGVDRRLQRITLDSIPRLRAFTNHTLLDVLFYTSPVYHQTIIDTVCFELNRSYNLFKERNPNFKGGISLGGHSLGSVILYDLLCNQTPNPTLGTRPSAEKTYLPDITSSQPIKYPKLQFQPDALYALGSPIAIFECIRGVETLGLDFHLPTCKKFFNIFHPYDPIAYRIEPLINSELKDSKPFLIPHHKGRKRMHLELKDTMVRVGADLKQKLLESLRTTWNKWKTAPPNDGQLEKVVEEEMEKEQLCEDSKEESQDNIELSKPDVLGRLNAGRRVDYVLQEAPLEMINEYLFAMSSHVGYWESEDTMLLMLREIYSSLGVQPDSTVPQQSMTVQRTKKLDEAMVVNEKDYPSTSRGGISS